MHLQAAVPVDRDARLSKMPHILTTTTAIRDGISGLMAPGTRRVAIVAFVGAGSTAYIPKPKGATIVCWPKAGGTTPSAVKDFMKRGARVLFADRVHMKVYWARGRGAVVGSANLSTNALGSGNLRELAVRLPDQAIDIDALLRSVAPREVTAQELKELEIQHRRIKWQSSGGSAGNSSPDFLAWFAQDKRAPWKLGWWDEQGEASKEAEREARKRSAKVRDAVTGRKDEYRNGDWVLMFRLGKNSVAKPSWLYVNFNVRFSTLAKTDHPHEFVQTFTPRECPAPPFRLDGKFSAAWKTACLEFDLSKLRKHEGVRPPRRLLRLVLERLT